MGVLAGLGPGGTVELVSRIQERTLIEIEQDHVPMVVNIDPMYPERMAVISNDINELYDQLDANA